MLRSNTTNKILKSNKKDARKSLHLVINNLVKDLDDFDRYTRPRIAEKISGDAIPNAREKEVQNEREAAKESKSEVKSEKDSAEDYSIYAKIKYF